MWTAKTGWAPTAAPAWLLAPLASIIASPALADRRADHRRGSRARTASAAQHPRPGAAYRLLDDAPPISVWLAWWKADPPHALHTLVEISRTASTSRARRTRRDVAVARSLS